MGRRNQVDVDLDGLAKLVADRKPRLGLELYQNARDTKGVGLIAISLRKVHPDEQDRLYQLRVVDDNPSGFHDLSHAYTMFVDSEKKDDPDASGMFNMGEKLLIAVSKETTIITTSGGVIFNDDGRKSLRRKTEVGSDVSCLLVLTKAEVEEMERLFKSIIVDQIGLIVTFNKVPLILRHALKTFRMKLTTPMAKTVADDVRYIQREATVGIYEVLPGETPSLYEHGIPVVPNNSRWHYVVYQKVPVPFDRDNVPPAYLQKLHTECVNQMHDYITPEIVNDTFVKMAMEDENIKEEAFKDLRVKKHGEKVVIHDPKYPEATKIAVSKGYNPLFGRSESKGFYENNRRFGDVKTAQEVTPQAIPFGEGPPIRMLDPEDISRGMQRVADFSRFIFNKMVSPVGSLTILWANDSGWGYNATFSRKGNCGQMIFNVGSLGYAWFDDAPPVTPHIISLIIHELGHFYCSDHLSADYYKALTDLGGKLTVLALTQPELLSKFRG